MGFFVAGLSLESCDSRLCNDGMYKVTYFHNFVIPFLVQVVQKKGMTM